MDFNVKSVGGGIFAPSSRSILLVFWPKLIIYVGMGYKSQEVIPCPEAKTLKATSLNVQKWCVTFE